MARDVWGIDIGRSGLKAVRMRRERGRVAITQVVAVPYGNASVVADTGREREIWSALSQLQEQFRMRNEKVVISVPGSETFIRSLSLLLVGRRSVHDLVHYEAQQEIPFVLDEVIWDYDLFEPDDPESREREGLLFAVKKILLSNYFMGLSSANVAADDVQSTPLAAYNYFCYDQDIGQACLVVDVGSDGTNLIGITPSEYWIRSLPLGGRKSTDVLASEFGMDKERAEAAKVNLARSRHAKQVLEVLMPSVMELVGEIQKSIAYQRTQSKDYPFERVYLVGGGAQLIGLKTLLARSLGLEVATLTQLGQIDVAEGADVAALQQDVGTFAVAMGLALQGCGLAGCDVSLIPQRAARRTMLGRTKPYVIGIPAAILLALLAMFGFAKQRHVALDRLHKAVVESKCGEIKALQERLEKAQATGALTTGLDQLVGIGQDRAVWLELLNELMRIVPDNARAEIKDQDKIWLVELRAEVPKPEAKPKAKKGAKAQGRRKIDGVVTAGVIMRGSETEALTRFGSLFENRLKTNPRFVSDSIRLIGGGPRAALRLNSSKPADGRSGFYICTIAFEFYATP